VIVQNQRWSSSAADTDDDGSLNSILVRPAWNIMLSSSFIAEFNSGCRSRGPPATLVVNGPGSFVPETATANPVGNALPFYLIGTASLPAAIAAT